MYIAIISSVLAWPDKLSAMGTICESSSLMCPVILKMTDFAKRKQDEEEWFSASFFSHDLGYKMCLNVDPDVYQENRGTYVHVHMVVPPEGTT